MTFTIQQADLLHLRTPLKKPFRTALGEHKSLNNLLVRIHSREGKTGYGEVAIAPHILGVTAETAAKQLKKVLTTLTGKHVSNIDKFTEHLPLKHAARCGVEMALFDIYCRDRNIPFRKVWGDDCARLKTGITIVIERQDLFLRSLINYYEQGFRTFKIKIGRDLNSDLKKIQSAGNILKKSCFYIDANQGFDLKQSLTCAAELKKMGLTPLFFEQPLARSNIEGLAKLTKDLDIRICADESLNSLSDAKKLIKEKAVNIFNIKLAKMGICEAAEATKLAKKNGIDLMMGMMMESSLGVSAAAQFAAGIKGFKYIDLDTPFYFKTAAANVPFLSESGRFKLSHIQKGMGWKPEKEA